MELISDGLLLVAALTATLYCVVLGRRLRRLSDAGTGIADQIKLLDKTLDETRTALRGTQTRLGELKGSAKLAAEKLARELKLAAETQAALETARAALERLLDEAGELSGTSRQPPSEFGSGMRDGESGADPVTCFDPLERPTPEAEPSGPPFRPDDDATCKSGVTAPSGPDGLLQAERVVL